MKAALLALATGSLLVAQSPSISVTNDAFYQRNELALSQDGKPKPGQFQEQLALVMAWGNWSGGLTLRDTNVYRIRSSTTLEQPDLSLYRAYLRYVDGDLSVQVGDFNAMLGRGLVLSVVQNDAVLRDWTIRGADLQWRAGWFDLHALAGTVSNNLNRLPLTGGAAGLQKWHVAGLETTAEWLPGQRIGLRSALIDDDRQEASVAQVGRLLILRDPEPRGLNHVGRRVSSSASLSGADLFGWLDYYAESAQTQYKQQERGDWFLPWPRPTDPTRGTGSYGSLTFHRSGWMVQGEVKRYRHLDNELNNAPLADKETERQNMDYAGGRRLLVQYTLPGPDLTLLASAGHYEEGDLTSRTPFVGNHVYGGFRLADWLEVLSASLTYGLKSVHPTTGNYLEKRTEASLAWRTTPLWSLELSGNERRRPGYSQWDLTLQTSRATLGSIFITQQYSSQVNLPENPSPWRHMLNGGLRVEVGRGSFATLTVGKQRGGEVCAGGQCALLPAEKGWKLATHVQF